MEAWINTLLTLVIEALVFPGFMFIMGMIIFTQWWWRKAAARMAYRRGPTRTGPAGMLQPLADFLKLLAKEDIRHSLMLRRLPVLITSFAVGAIITVILFTPLSPVALWSPYDIVIVMYLLLWVAVSMALYGLSAPNPYTNLGLGRYLALLTVSEPALFAAFLVPTIVAAGINPATQYSLYWTIVNAASLWTSGVVNAVIMAMAAVTAFFAILGVMTVKPFDFPEAEGEIYWGMFTEYGGPRLALGFFVAFAEKIVLPMLYVMLFLGGAAPFSFADNYVLAFVAVLLKYLAVFTLIAMIDTMMPRYRPDQGIRFMIKYAITPAAIALVFAVAALTL